ncbi:MAG: acyltransferase [Eubacterium sp.]|nr:acyltransferase [Eubacterium sp.]
MNDNKQAITKRESENFDIIRVIAILSVIAAHTNEYVETPVLREVITFFWSSFGTVGVPAFLILGGFFYHREQGDTRRFWTNKAKNVIFPWILCSTLMFFLYGIVKGNSMTFAEYMKYILGCGTWFYYMTIYVVCLVLFRFFWKNTKALVCIIIVTSVSLLLCTFGIYLEIGYMNVYLNPLNWIGYFALGILIRKYRLDRKVVRQRFALPSCVVMMCLSYIFMMITKKNSYFNFFSGIWEVSVFVILLFVADIIQPKFIRDFIIWIGKITFSIYLLHMPIVQPFCKLLPNNLFGDIFKPVAGFIVVVFIAFVGLKICERISIGKYIKRMVGIRDR